MINSKNQFNQNNPDVSIIIPVYNAEKYLNQCIDSVLNQTLENIEIICIDDCSTDSSFEIIQEYAKKDKRIIAIQNKENLGPSTRNKGLNIAKGEYICFVDADDWIEKETLKYSFNITKGNNLNLLIFKLKTYNEDTGNYNKTDNYAFNIIKEFDNKIFNYRDINPKVVFHMSVTSPGKLYHNKLINYGKKIRFMENTYYEDNLFFIEVLLKAERISLIDKYFYIRRVHSKSIMQKKGIELKNIIDISEAILNVIIKDYVINQEYRQFLYNKLFNNILNFFKMIDLEYLNDYYEYFKQFIIRCIVDYKIHEDIQNLLWYNNLEFYKLALKSIKTSDKKIKDYQKDITLKYKISVIINSSNHSFDEIKEIFKSLIKQSIGFSFLNIYFMNNNNCTQYFFKELEKNFDNVHVINLNWNNQDIYYDSLDYISTDLVIFVNQKLNETFLEKLNSKINEEQLNISLPSKDTLLDYSNQYIFNNKNNDYIFKANSILSVENKLFKTSFIKNKEVFIGEKTLKENIFIDTFQKSYKDLLDFFENQLDHDYFESNALIFSILRNTFLIQNSKKRNKSFKDFQNFFEKLIVKNNSLEEVKKGLNCDDNEFLDRVINTKTITEFEDRDISKYIFIDN